jgi:Holliday junction resolvase-like predicted endonuclease
MEAAPLRLVLTRLLALTNDESVDVEKLRGSMRITSEALNDVLSQLGEWDLITVDDGHISLSLDQRLQLAMKAVEVGADFESVSRSLDWLEFEEISAKVLEENRFRVLRRFRFHAESRRWEIDLLAVRAPYLVCAECKHWGRGMGNQTTRGIVETHLEKTEVLSRFVETLTGRIGIESWTRTILVPMVLTLSATPMEIYRRVPSVSVLTLPSFIGEFDGQLERLANFRVELTPKTPSLKQMKISGRASSGSRRARHRL